jgi:hypothetical protein
MFGFHLMKALCGVQLNFISFYVMRIAKKQEVVVAPALFVSLIGVEALSGRRGGLDVADLTDELVSIVHQLRCATRKRTTVA